MKIIFLDNDGVICLSNNWGTRFKKRAKLDKIKLSTSPTELPVEYRFDTFDKKAIKVLNEILLETDADIVISSDWKRHASLDELGDYYESQGIIKRPIGVTESFHYSDWSKIESLSEIHQIEWNRNESLEQNRYFEIKKYLIDHPEITQWVSVDDLNMGIHIKLGRGCYDRKWGLKNFVWTPICDEGIKQSGIKEKIINYLK